MDPQNIASQPAPVVSPPVQPIDPPVPVQEKESHKFVWIVAGIVVLLIGIGIGVFLKR